MAELDIAHDPVMRLLPTEGMPDAFLRFDAKEQARRGRLWLTMYGAGYEEVHAWWFATSDYDDIAELLDTIKDVPDEEFAKMLQGRQTYEAGKALEQSQVTQ